MVRTTYLDQAFEGLTTIPDQIDLLERRIAKREARLERWSTKKDTVKRIGKRVRQGLRLDADRQLLAARQDLLTEYRSVEFPQDEFFVTLTKDLVEGKDVGGYLVDVVDSPYDDSFTGGDRLKMRSSFTGRHTQHGFSSYHSTFSLANGPYWPEGEYTKTLQFGRSTLNADFERYPRLDTKIFLEETEEVLHTQAFDLTTYFG